MELFSSIFAKSKEKYPWVKLLQCWVAGCRDVVQLWRYVVKYGFFFDSVRCREYAMSLMGEFFNYQDFVYLKRYYKGSTHDTWQETWRPVDIFYS